MCRHFHFATTSVCYVDWDRQWAVINSGFVLCHPVIRTTTTHTHSHRTACANCIPLQAWACVHVRVGRSRRKDDKTNAIENPLQTTELITINQTEMKCSDVIWSDLLFVTYSTFNNDDNAHGKAPFNFNFNSMQQNGMPFCCGTVYFCAG